MGKGQEGTELEKVYQSNSCTVMLLWQCHLEAGLFTMFIAIKSIYKTKCILEEIVDWTQEKTLQFTKDYCEWITYMPHVKNATSQVAADLEISKWKDDWIGDRYINFKLFQEIIAHQKYHVILS